MSKPAAYVVVEMADSEILNVSAFSDENVAMNFAVDIAAENAQEEYVSEYPNVDAMKDAIKGCLSDDNRVCIDNWEVSIWPIGSLE